MRGFGPQSGSDSRIFTFHREGTMARVLTRIEKLANAIKEMSDDPAIDALADQILLDIKPQDKREDRKKPSLRR